MAAMPIAQAPAASHSLFWYQEPAKDRHSIAYKFTDYNNISSFVHQAAKPTAMSFTNQQTHNSSCASSGEEYVRTLGEGGGLKDLLGILYVMNQQNSYTDSQTYGALLQACANEKALTEGEQVHAHVLKSANEHNIFVATKLVIMYSKCRSMWNARLVFDNMAKQNVFSWNAMMEGYVRLGYCEETLELFRRMQPTDTELNPITIACVLPACSNLAALERGREIHGYAIKRKFVLHVFVGSALIDMYAKCGSIANARHVFDKMPQRNVVLWTAMLAGYARSGLEDEAKIFFRQMQKAGVELNVITWTAMIAGYVQNGCVTEALDAFYEMQLTGIKPNSITWSVMIAGFVQNGHCGMALKMFYDMHMAGLKPTSVTVASVLPACAHSAALQKGKEIHGYVIRHGFETDIFVSSALVDMYAKCGNIDNAHQVFDRMSQKNIVSWNAMIAGYALNGQYEDTFRLFYQMQQTGVQPDDITFTGLLSVCSHAGLVDDGYQYFDSMSQKYSITPSVEHYACMVDLLGRAGRLGEAQDFISKMPIEPNSSVWGALLGACRIHCNIDLGERVAEHLLELEPENTGNYVLLSNIYAATNRWDDVTKVRKMLKDRRLKKIPGCSWVEVKNRVHPFLVGDKSHPQTEKIYAMLESLTVQIKEAGYVPDTNFVLHDVVEEEKEHLLGSHSEKLAIAFALINTCPRTPIRVIKNLRVCGDCHIATKFISKIVEREIIVRDTNRFHHFKEGSCSCGDYW